MTVSTDTNKAGPFEGNGSATSFAFTFKVFDSSDVVVTYTDDEGTETVLVEDSDYTVTLNADQDDNPGGSVTYPASGSAMDADEFLTLTRNVAATQETELPSGGGWYPRVIEHALDKVTMLVQQALETLSRCVRFPVSDQTTTRELPSAVDRASKVLGFDADGEPIAVANVPTSGVTATAWAETLLDDTSAPAASATILGDTITPSQLTGNATDYNPAGLSAATAVRLSSNSIVAIFSLATGSAGRVLILHNVGSYTIVLLEDDGATGTAAMRFAIEGYINIPAGGSVVLQYDGTSSRWRLATPQPFIRDYEPMMGMGDFEVWAEGTTFSSPASGTFVATLWRALYDGTAGTFTIDQAGGPLSTGAFNGIRWRQTAAGSGDTYRVLEYRIQDGATFNGQRCTLSFLASCESGTVTVTPTITQFFGTGGSPSTAVVASNESVTLTTTLNRFTVSFDMPSTSGKTFGSDFNDCVKFGLYLPTNATFNAYFSEVKLENTPYRTPHSRVPLPLKWQHIEYQLQYLRVNAIDKADAGGEQHMVNLPFTTRMRAVPTATITSGGARTNLAATFPKVADLTTYGGRYVIEAAAGGSYSALGEIVTLDARI